MWYIFESMLIQYSKDTLRSLLDIIYLMTCGRINQLPLFMDMCHDLKWIQTNEEISWNLFIFISLSLSSLGSRELQDHYLLPENMDITITI